MLWKEIKSWAKTNGYQVIKKEEEQKEYYWKKIDSDSLEDGGVAKSVSKLALAIYNHMTQNKWVGHQELYKQDHYG